MSAGCGRRCVRDGRRSLKRALARRLYRRIQAATRTAAGFNGDLSAHSTDDLDWVAADLNDRPRKRLGFKKPIEQIGPLLLR